MIFEDKLMSIPIAHQQVNQAFHRWRHGDGVLTGDRNIVIAMCKKFKGLADNAMGIPEYRLMAVDAQNEYLKIRSIIKHRYNIDVSF